jgi:hypothetical protein
VSPEIESSYAVAAVTNVIFFFLDGLNGCVVRIYVGSAISGIQNNEILAETAHISIGITFIVGDSICGRLTP